MRINLYSTTAPGNHRTLRNRIGSLLGMFLAGCVLLHPVLSVRAADTPVQQLTYETAGYLNGCGTMQGGASDGQYLYYACTKDNKITIIKMTTDGKQVDKSKAFSRSELGHANDMTYNSKLQRLVVSAWDTNGGGNKVRLVDPNSFEITGTLSTSNGNSTSNICYNAATDRYVIGGRQYDSNLNSLDRIYTQDGVDEDADIKEGLILNQGIECDANMIYVMRVVAIRNHGYNVIATYDWNGNNQGVYRLNLNDEGENMALVNGVLYMGVNEGVMSDGGNSNNDYFIRISGLGAGTINSCGGGSLDESTVNQYIDWAIGKYGQEQACCSEVTSDGGLVGDSNAEKAFNFLISNEAAIKTNNNQPLSAAQAAGVIGNLMLESGGNTYKLDPSIVNSIGASGIVQWLGGRLKGPDGLKKFASDKGTEWTDLRTQLEFIIFELERSEAAIVKDSAFKNVKNTADGAATAAARWAQLYERPGPPPYAQREKNARQAFADFGSGASMDTTPNTTAPATTSDDQSLDAGCSSTGTGDYVFPLQATKAEIRKWHNDPGTNEWKSGRYHEDRFEGYYAVDIMAPEGTPIVAFHSGTVIQIKNGDSFGALSVQIKDDDGYTYYYQHMSLSRGAKVKEDQKVEGGTLLGYVGNSQEAWGAAPHLHIDKSKNPGNGLRGTCTASRGYCPIASEHRFVKIVKELHDSYETLSDTQASGL